MLKLYLSYKLLGIVFGIAGLIGLLILFTVVSSNQAKQASAIANSGLTVSSPAFKDGQALPAEYACTDNPPPLVVSGIPAKASHLVIRMDDLDSGSAVVNYWTVWNIPVSGGAMNLPPVSDAATTGINAFGRPSYQSPCLTKDSKPNAANHRYRIRVEALSRHYTYSQPSDVSKLYQQTSQRLIGRAEITFRY